VVRLPDDVRAALDELRAILARRFAGRLAGVILFGSYARGVVHEDSDVDVLVLVDLRERRDGRAAVDAAVEVMLRHPDVVLSPLVMTPAELASLRAGGRRLARDIDRDGIRL
jgi:predicted nucleotidyltransferase